MPDENDEALVQVRAEVARLTEQLATLQNANDAANQTPPETTNNANSNNANNNANNVVNQGTVPSVNSIYRQPKISAFSRENPTEWFTQAEITLRNAGITVAATKVDFIAEKLDLEALSTIQDIVEAVPPPRDIFDQVKKRLIGTYGSSAETRLRQLIKRQVSTIGKPSLILNRLRGLKTGELGGSVGVSNGRHTHTQVSK